MGNVLKEIRKKRRQERIESIKEDVEDFIENTTIYQTFKEIRETIYLYRAWKCFCKMLTPESLAEITAIEKAMETIVSYIRNQSGWWLSSDYSFCYVRDYRDMHYSYEIYRNENGYYVKTDELIYDCFGYVMNKEVLFFEKYKSLLESLHILINEREKFYNGGYKLKYSRDKEMAQKLLITLGRIKEPKEEKTLK